MNEKIKYLFIEMRPYQWIKNFFIFLPLVFGEKLFDASALIETTAAFFIFSFAASAMYLINDIIDLKSDESHPTRRLRPLASGNVTSIQARVLAYVLMVIAVLFSFILDRNICAVLIIYIALNYIYTKFLNRAVIIDVFCVGAFFYLRILVGSFAANVTLSNWIILCTVLLALFLAFTKRLYDLKVAEESKVIYKKYSDIFLERMISIISALIVMSYSLYTMDQQTMRRLGTQHMFYTIPFVCYGLFRYLYLIEEPDYTGDPTIILLKDRKMQINLLLWILLTVGIIYFKL